MKTSTPTATRHTVNVLICFTVAHDLIFIASDFSLSLNVALALERYLSFCQPMWTVHHPWLKKSLVYIASALLLSSIKAGFIFGLHKFLLL